MKSLISLLFAIALVPLCEAADSVISVAIAVPAHGSHRVLEYSGGHESHFHVLISNVSDKPQKIWREWCSWGYYALSFEITDESGKTWTATKKARDWDKNFPDSWTLAAKETLVLDVHFAGSDTWEGFPRPSGVSQTITIRAIFEISPDKDSQRDSVWTGRALSKADKFVIYR